MSSSHPIHHRVNRGNRDARASLKIAKADESPTTSKAGFGEPEGTINAYYIPCIIKDYYTMQV